MPVLFVFYSPENRYTDCTLYTQDVKHAWSSGNKSAIQVPVCINSQQTQNNHVLYYTIPDSVSVWIMSRLTWDGTAELVSRD